MDKRLLRLILVAAGACWTGIAAASPLLSPLAVKCDVNHDGIVDVGDVNTVLAGILADSNDAGLDANSDGAVDVGDVNLILEVILSGDVDASVDNLEYIDIDFAGQGADGATPTVETVTVVNVTTGDLIELGGNDILRLAVKGSEAAKRRAHSIKENKGRLPRPVISPAVSMADARLTFDVAKAGATTIEVIDRDGKVAARSVVTAKAGRNSLKLKAMEAGRYTVRLTDAAGRVQATQWRSAARRATGKTVTMDFTAGDLLRFTAKSSDMTTILMQQPANSHTNTFSFFECKDADGYCYPIIEAGGLMWMAEDLRYARRSGVSKVSNATDWQDASATKCMVIGGDVADAYYNYEGALKALPEGWRLPTADEVNTVLRKLGGADRAGALLKAHGDDSNWGSWEENVDSVYLRLNAHGYINSNGNVTSHDQRGYIITSTTLSKRPMWAELKDGSDAVTFSSQGASVHNGFHIRGVRVGFSPYKGMMDKFFSDEIHAARRVAAKAPVNPYSGQPIGEMYTVNTGISNMLVDWGNTETVQGAGAAGGWEWMQDDVPAANGLFSVDAKGTFTKINNDAVSPDNIKKFAIQYTPDNHKIAKLTFLRSRNKAVLITGGYNRYSETEGWAGTGQAKLDIIAKDGSNVEAFTLPGEFTMPNGWEAYRFRFWGNNESTWTDMFDVYDYFAKRVQILCADFTDDQVDDILLGIAGRFLIIDGSDYNTILAERTFNCTSTRATAGDFNGDGHADIAFVAEINGQILAQVYCDGPSTINGTATYTAGLGTRINSDREPWLDIKMGDVVVPNRTDLICQVGDVNDDRKYVAKTSVWAKQGSSSALVPPIKGSTIEETNNYLQNSCITVAHVRGMGYPADILAAGGLYRFDGTNSFSTEKTGMTSIENPGGFQGWDEGNKFIYFPADNVYAGKFDKSVPDGVDQIAVLSVIDAYGQWHKWNGSSSLYWIGAQWRGLIRIYTAYDGYLSGHNIETSIDDRGAGVRIGNVWGWKEDNEVSDCYTHPAFCPIPAADAHRASYRFRSMDVTFTNPQIHAVLAAAPYYAEADYGNYAIAATSWGKTSSSGTGSGRSSSNSAKLITGYNNEVGFISKAYEIDVTASVEYNNTFGEESEEVITYGKEYTAFEDNSVIMTITPYFVYNYECVSSDNEDAVGTMLTVGCPYTSSEQNVAMTDYMLMRADNAEIPDLTAVLHNTPGDPMSYPQYEDEIKSNCGSSVYWALPKGELQGLGQGGTSTALTHSVENSTTYTKDHQLNVNFELVNTVFGAKVGFGYGHSENWSSSHSTGIGHSIAGEVPAPKQFNENVSSFRWNLCRYNMLLNGQVFPVVNYVVRR